MKHHIRITVLILILFLLISGGLRPISVYAGNSTAASSSAGTTTAKKTKKYTKYNGVDLSAIYDFDYYVTHNKYAKKHFKNKPKEAILYFGRYAIRKNVRAKAEYSKATYKKLYKKTHPFPAADKILDKTGWNLKSAFLYAANFKAYHGSDLGERNSPWKRTSMWYFRYLQKHRHGNCYCKSGTFTILATEMGYECQQIGGYVPYRSGYNIPHSWMEIKRKGKTYVCDPSFYYNTGGRSGYMIKYGQKGTYKYSKPHKLKLK